MVAIPIRPQRVSVAVRASAALAAVSTLFASAAGFAAAACPESPFRTPRPLIIAHASGNYFGPANTIEMLRAAKRAGADVLDVDVRVTRDGVHVAAHDDFIRSRGWRALRISSATLREVEEIDLGERWPGPRGNYPLRGGRVRVPTVEAILEAFPRDRIGLELKTVGGEQVLCDMLRRLGRTRDVFVSSNGDAPVDRFRSLCPEVTTTVTDAIVFEMRAARTSKQPWCAPVGIGQPPLRQGDFVLTRENVRWNHEHGLAVYTWTADDSDSLELAMGLGVDGVYTSRPDLARRILNH